MIFFWTDATRGAKQGERIFYSYFRRLSEAAENINRDFFFFSTWLLAIEEKVKCIIGYNSEVVRSG